MNVCEECTKAEENVREYIRSLKCLVIDSFVGGHLITHSETHLSLQSVELTLSIRAGTFTSYNGLV